ncbi:MAG: LamG-like jellyroll fold domain-containing protein [Phycisphaerales bacterium]
MTPNPPEPRRPFGPATLLAGLTLAASVGPAVAAASAGSTPATLPVEAGDMITASYSGFAGGGFTDPDPFGPVVTLTDVRVPPLFGNPFPVAGAVWTPPMFNNIPSAPPANEWIARHMGQVFGLALGRGPEPDIHAAATSAYGNFLAYPFPSGGLGPDGPGAIYRIDGVTGEIMPWVVTGFGGPGTNEMPNGGPAIGNIALDEMRDQFFATNLDDGGIYRIDSSGVIMDVYDPWLPSGPANGQHVDLGDRPWAVAVLEDRLFFSVWLRDNGRPSTPWPAGVVPVPSQPNNSIWSLEIDPASGALVGAPQLEVVMPWLSTVNRWSNPVSDISFGRDGQMLLAERTMPGDYGIIDVGHAARLLEYVGGPGSWTPSANNYSIGTLISGITGTPINCAGGADYGCGDADLPDVWTGGDIIGLASYGVQRVPPGGNTPGTPISTSWLIPWPVSLKGGVGDVDLAPGCGDIGPEPCPIECPSDSFFEDEPCGTALNNGCQIAGAEMFDEIECGTTVCGRLWAEGGVQDQDAYRIFLPDFDGDGSSMLRVKLQSSMPAAVRIMGGSCDAPIEYAVGYSFDCEATEVMVCLPAPGEYWISLTPEDGSGPIFGGYPCDLGWRYRMDVECMAECPCYEPPSSMIGWFPLDESAGPVADELIQGADGTWIGSPTPVAGYVDGALCFDGASAVERTPAPELTIGQEDLSIDAWIRPAAGVGGTQKIVDQRLEAIGTVQGYSFFIFGTTRQLAIQLADNGSGAGFTNFLSGVSVPANEWSLVAVTVDRDQPDGGRFYINGALVATFNPTGRPASLANTGNFRIGSRSSSATGFFNGCIDEVEVFSRALSADEILGLYAAGPAGKCKPDTLPCPGDVDGDGVVTISDLLVILASWGPCPGGPCPGDLNGDGFVNFSDLIIMIAGFGPCP